MADVAQMKDYKEGICIGEHLFINVDNKNQTNLNNKWSQLSLSDPSLNKSVKKNNVFFKSLLYNCIESGREESK